MHLNFLVGCQALLLENVPHFSIQIVGFISLHVFHGAMVAPLAAPVDLQAPDIFSPHIPSLLYQKPHISRRTKLRRSGLLCQHLLSSEG